MTLTGTERRRYESALDHRDLLKMLATKLTNPVLLALIHQGRHVVQDAYTTGTQGTGNDISRPTEAAVTRDAGGRIIVDLDGTEECTPDLWRAPSDHVGEAIDAVFAHLSEAAGILEDLNRNFDFVTNITETSRGRVSSLQGDCLACFRPVAGTTTDRLKAGYCPACHQAWKRKGYPDRREFEITRRREAS